MLSHNNTMRAGRGCLFAAAGRGGGEGVARRLMGTVAKGTIRAAVHGLRPPSTTTVQKDEAEKEIKKGAVEKLKAREEVEKKVDSKITDSAEGSRK